MIKDKISAAFDRADEGLRGWLLGSCRGAWAFAALTLAAFFALLNTRTFTQLNGAPAAERICTLLVFCAPLFVMLVFALRITREREDGMLSVLAAYALCALAMLMRLSFIERSSGDYDIYLANWLQKLGEGSFSEGMRANIGEYNVLYQYILFLITRLPVPSLYAVKAVSFIGDAFLAGAAARLARRGGRDSLAAFAAVLLLPTIALNGGMFAQCDSLYACCALWGLAFAMGGRPVRSAVCFALALSFKLQAVFVLPMVAVLWAHRRLRLQDALVFAAALVAVMLPALLGGKSLGAILGVYTAQTGLYTGLNYNAANFFALMNTDGLDVYAYGNFGMALALGACALIVYTGMRKENAGRIVRYSLLMVLLVVFFLPRMHERYFYMALPLAVAYAAERGGRRAFVPVLIELAMLATHWELAISHTAAALMMLLAAVLVTAGGKGDCARQEL